jgi:Spy/CpxP family protein refolding chaperone
MKKLGLLLIILFLVAGATYAQERGGGGRPSKTMPQGGPGRGNRPQMNPEEMVKRQTQRLVEELKLNKDQEAKVQAINKKYMGKQSFDFAKMRDASDEERQKMREEMMKVQAERNKEIRAVLTPDQAKIFDENQKKREEMRRNGQGRMGGFGGGPQ